MLHTPARRYASQGAPMIGRPIPEYSVVGVFRDVSSAREAMDALSRGGQEVDNISLTGLGIDKLFDEINGWGRGGSLTPYVGRGVLKWATYGAGAGALGGFMIAILLAAMGSAVSGAGTFVAMIFGAVGGGMLGGFIGGVSPQDPTETWELTFEKKRGRAIVGVHTNRQLEAERAEHILENQHPVDLYRISSDGLRI